MTTWISEAPLRLLVFGLGYTGTAVARAAARRDLGQRDGQRRAGTAVDDGIVRIDFAARPTP